MHSENNAQLVHVMCTTRLLFMSLSVWLIPTIINARYSLKLPALHIVIGVNLIRCYSDWYPDIESSDIFIGTNSHLWSLTPTHWTSWVFLPGSEGTDQELILTNVWTQSALSAIAVTDTSKYVAIFYHTHHYWYISDPFLVLVLISKLMIFWHHLFTLCTIPLFTSIWFWPTLSCF